MKNSLSVIFALLISVLCFSQNGINYKALIKDGSGNVVANQMITVQFSILTGIAQTNVYQETHTPITDINGVVIINIGEGTVDSGDFSIIDWGSNEHFLNVKINTGAGLTDMGTTQFKSVPYANFAEDTRKGTLNDAYDKGGNGAGRIIDATDGNVEVKGDGFTVKTAANDATLFADGLTNRVGVGTDTPQGALDISSTNAGLVLPRVSSIEDVTDGDGNPPVDGTMVFDTSSNRFCMFTGGDWVCLGFDSNGNATAINTALSDYELSDQSYFKASNATSADYFGMSVAMSGDGLTMAIGAPNEGSSATTINGDQTNTSNYRGAVYIFHYDGTQWLQQAYIKPSSVYFSFGLSVSLDFTGNTLVAGRDNEVFVFRRSGSTWTEQQQILYPQPFWGRFGAQVDLSNDGNTVAISAYTNTSTDTGVGASQAHSTSTVYYYGGVYIYSFNGTAWVEEEFFKANVIDNDFFGVKIALSGDATVLVVGAPSEDSDAVGVNGDENNDLAPDSGAVYVYRKIASAWQFEAYLKASNTESNDRFGHSLAISGDGHTIVVGAPYESGGFSGINASNGLNNYKPGSGAAYVFNDITGPWVQEAYIKSSVLDNSDFLGFNSLAINENGSLIAIGSYEEDSLAKGVNSMPSTDNGLSKSGAVILFQKAQGNWTQSKMLKATNPRAGNQLSRAEYSIPALINSNFTNFIHYSSNIAMNANGDTIIAGCLYESSNATGIQGNQEDTSAIRAGAVYMYNKVD